MCFEIPLVDAPATPRRDIAVVGLDSILLEAPIASEVAGVLPKHPFIEVFEGGFSVDVIGDDPGPVVVAPVAGGPFGEPLKLAGCVPSIVPTVTTGDPSPCPEDSA